MAPSVGGPAGRDSQRQVGLCCFGRVSEAVADAPTFVLASFEPGTFARSSQPASFLQSVARKGMLIAGIKTGTETLAHRRVAIHWDCHDSLCERHSDIEINRTEYKIDGRIAMYADALSNLDLMLHLIERADGPYRVMEISWHLLHRQHFQSPVWQVGAQLAGKLDVRLQRAIGFMEARTEASLTSPEIAKWVGLSQRHFGGDYGIPPSKFYHQLRVNQAHRLLQWRQFIVVNQGLESLCRINCGATGHR